MNDTIPQVGNKVSFKSERSGTLTGRVNAVVDGKVLISVRRNSWGGGGLFRIPLNLVTIVPAIDPRNHSEKGLGTLTAMRTAPADWGLAAIKWELRRMLEEVWVLCPLCKGTGRIGTVNGKTVDGCTAWNSQASKTIRTCTKCPQVHFTRKGREWYRKDDDGVWRGNGGGHHGDASSANNYSFMNGLVLDSVTVERKVGIVQWAVGTKFDSRFGSGCNCALCSKTIPSGQFAPVTGKGADGVIHGMWVGMDCARKFFGIKNFKKDQVVERPEAA